VFEDILGKNVSHMVCWKQIGADGIGVFFSAWSGFNSKLPPPKSRHPRANPQTSRPPELRLILLFGEEKIAALGTLQTRLALAEVELEIREPGMGARD
jgi:hypothetical protein